MENSQFLTKRKVVFIGIGLMGIFVVVLLDIVLSSQKNAQLNSNSSVSSQPTIISSAPTIPVSPTSIQQHQLGGLTYSYPADWEVKPTNIFNGGQLLIIRKDDSQQSDFPIMEIEVAPVNAQYSIPTIIQNLEPLQLTQSNSTFHGIADTELKGITALTYTTIDKKKAQIYKRFIILEHNNSIYIISYAYLEDQNASSNEAYFSSLVNSYQLQ